MKIEIPWSGPIDGDSIQCTWDDVAVDPVRVARDPNLEEVSGTLQITLDDAGGTIVFTPEGGGKTLGRCLAVNDIMALLK